MLNTKAAWSLIFISALLPLVYILVVAVWGDLGAEPAKAMVEFLGEAALWLLLVTLSVTPLRRFSLLRSLLRYRRMLGLFAFFYASLHLLAYGALLVDWQNFVEDLYKRLYVTMGFLAFVILLALAVTSPKVMVRRLGRRWRPLHRLVYLAALLVLVHVWWQTRSDYGELLLYASVLSALLIARFRYFVTWFKSFSD